MYLLLPQLLLNQSVGHFGEPHRVQLVFVPPRTVKATLSKPDRTAMLCCVVLRPCRVSGCTVNSSADGSTAQPSAWV